MIVIKRIYDPAAPEDGKRYLADRLWPRGIGKETARLDGWLKDLAPSPDLRAWFGHDPLRWEEFKRRYREELAAPEAAAQLDRLRAEAGEGRVTLLFAAADRERNNAACLKEVLEAAPPPATGRRRDA